MDLGRTPRWVGPAAPVAAALAAGALSLLMIRVVRVPWWELWLLCIPLLAGLAGLVLLLYHRRVEAALVAAGALGYCLTGTTTWLGHVEFLTCHTPSFLLREIPRLAPTTPCSWVPTRLGGIWLMVLLASSGALLIFTLGRAGDWLPWAVEIGALSAMGFVAFWSSAFNPSPGTEIPRPAILAAVLTAGMAVAAIIGWRIGSARGGAPPATAT